MSIIHVKNNQLESRIDEVIHIQFKQLHPNQMYKIILRRRAVTKTQIIYRESWANFTSSLEGTIDVTNQKPVAGSYDTVNAMGLFWSMDVIKKEENKGEPYIKLAPHQFELSIELNDQVIERKFLTKRWYDNEMKRKEVNEGGVIGSYFYHQGQESRPTVIVLSGSEGGIYEFVAGPLASGGFNVLAIAYFGVEGTTDRLVNIPLERVEDAIKWLIKQDESNKIWIGVHGTSRGSEIALWSAVLFDEVKAVVSMNGSGIAFSGIVPWTDDLKLPPAWLYKGESLPYASPNNPVHVALSCKALYQKGKNGALDWYDALYNDELYRKEATIPIEATKKDILFISGASDQMFRSSLFSSVSRSKWIKQINYEGAGHEIGIPHVPIYANKFTGGTKEATYKASFDSWEKMKEWFILSYQNRLRTK
ncbi:acyl-CoA thioesterase/bile acid-CoA:amino acid N-acyltransferase family protein [Shouchella patagoniensis]|uniref:acyl-CoA thioesterase/bile acid-CoA:amino acid N-acyltransferase family protein n=1 Tax=Shouchella patagoniensis TaxID=228576 RepID=UPI0009954229|nr:acyl-CoA thioesterase/bile acid-CoA:amino acid N-acyltransferase family protein [Shouchella patagoniensis]